MRPKEFFSKLNSKLEPSDVDKLKTQNPNLWKKLKNLFDTGRLIIQVQLMNGLANSNEKTLRYYLSEFAARFLNYGPNSFPLSFNSLEPFFKYNQTNSVLQLIEEEESYGVSLIDFLDYVTDANFKLDNIDLYENIPENLIYHFTFTSGVDEINFSNEKGGLFYISGLSLVRQGNEVSLLMQAGESYDKKEAESYFSDKSRKHIEESITPRKKELGLKLDNTNEPKVVHFENREGLWLHSISMLFDIEHKVIDIRYVGRDENTNYSVFTDDYNGLFCNEGDIAKEKIKSLYESQIESLQKYEAVFDFAKYCLALPFYVFNNEDKIVDITYETSLSEIIKGPISRKQYSSVPGIYKLFAKPFYYIESDSQAIIEKKELDDSYFQVNKSGFWKRLGIDEDGFDKKGRKIVGKTWVERTETYFQAKKGVTTVNKFERFDSVNAGFIYIMRQPAYEENIFKIGLTMRSSEERSKELSNTSAIDKFYIINNFHTKDCIEAEKQIHKELDIYRINSIREFFKCDLKKIIEVCERVTNKINE